MKHCKYNQKSSLYLNVYFYVQKNKNVPNWHLWFQEEPFTLFHIGSLFACMVRTFKILPTAQKVFNSGNGFFRLLKHSLYL